MAFDDEITKQTIYPAVFIDLLLDSGETNIWTGIGSVNVDGKDYLSLAGFDSAFSIQEGVEVEDLAADLRIAGQQAEFLAISLNEPAQGREASVWIGALDSDGNVVEREKVFAGIIRNMPIRQSVEAQDISIEVESSLTFRNNGAVLRCSTADQRLIDAEDTLFDFLPGLEASDLRFGR